MPRPDRQLCSETTLTPTLLRSAHKDIRIHQAVNFFLIAVVLIFAPATGFGIPHDSIAGSDLAEVCEILIDVEGTLTIDDVVRPTARATWSSCQSESLSRGYSSDTVWLRFDFENFDPEPYKFYIHIPIPWISDIVVYQDPSSNLLPKRHYGSGYLYAQRDISASGFFIPMTLAPAGASEVYLQIVSRGALTIGGKLLSERQMGPRNLLATTFNGFLIGGILLLTMFNFSLYLKLGDRNYLNYSLFSLSALLFCGTIYGFNYQFLWPTLIDFNFRMNAATVAFGNLLMLNFARRFLTVPKLSSLADKVLITIACLDIIGMGLSFLSDNHYTNTSYVAAVGGIGTSYILFLAIYAWRSKVAAAGYFLVAWSASLVGMLILVMMAEGVFEYSAFNYYAAGVGILLEMPLLSIALADRIKVLQNEKDIAQKRLADSLVRSRDNLENEVAERTKELEVAKKEAEVLAQIDPLTNLSNRRAFFDYSEIVDRQHQRSGEAYCVAMIDIDYFKNINDEHGHRVGDQALEAIGKTIDKVIRRSDIAGRIGGEEFAIVLPQTKIDSAITLGERLRQEISEIVVQQNGHDVRFTTSIGIAESGTAATSLEDVLDMADQALYRAKDEGRNRVLTLA